MPVFRKTTPAAELCRFEAEAAGLAALRATGSVRVPVVIAVGITNGLARIDLEHLDLAGLDRSSGATMLKLNVVPCPRPALRACMVPPISSASRLLMARPSPVPPYLRVVLASAWLKL